MKAISSILIVLITFAACAQKKTYPVKEVPVTDGGNYEYVLYPKQDSVRWYNPGQDTFKISVHFEKLSAGYPAPDVITNVDNALDEYVVQDYVPRQFSGENIVNPLGWTFTKGQLSNVAHHNNTLSILETDGWVEYGFTGHKIEWYAEQFESYGIAGVSIDKGPETMVDLYRSTNINNSVVMFTADSLDNNANHVIRVRYTAQRNPNANSGKARITHDKFVTYYTPGTFYPPPTQQKKKSTTPKKSN